MDLINKIGQRKVAKLLFFATIVISLLSYMIRYFLYKDYYVANMVPLTGIVFKAVFGTLLLSAPVGILALTAHKTTEYRMFCIFNQAAILLVNTVFFYLGVDLIYLTLGEIVLTTAFFIFAKKSDEQKRATSKKSKTRTIGKSE